MGDLSRDEAKIQPTLVPILSTPHSEYDAPGEAWNDAGTRAELSDGEEAIGLVPNTPLPAEVANDLLGRLGQGVATTLDFAAVNGWADTLAANTGEPNDNHWGTRAAVVVGPFGYYGGVYQELLLQFNPAKLFYSYDGHRWVDAGVHGLSGTPTGFAVGHSVISSANYVSILGWDNTASGVMRVSHNVGASWADAGNLPASYSAGGNVGGFFNPDHSGVGRFFVCGPSQLYYSDHDDLSGEWTRITTSSLGWTGAPPPAPLCFASSPTECAIGIDGAPSVIHSSDGNTWAPSALSTDPGDGVKALHWSASHEKWIALTASNNRILTSSAGFGVWAERAQITDANANVITDLVDVCSLGRTVVVSAGGRLWVSRDLDNWRALPLKFTDDGINADEWTWLRVFNGRLWAGRKRQVSGDASLEYAMSFTLPSEFSATAGGSW